MNKSKRLMRAASVLLVLIIGTLLSATKIITAFGECESTLSVDSIRIEPQRHTLCVFEYEPWSGVMEDSNGLKYYRFDSYVFDIGDKLYVTYSDGSVAEYTWEEPSSQIRSLDKGEGKFICEGRKDILFADLNITSSQEIDHWMPGEERFFTATYQGKSCNYYYHIRENIYYSGLHFSDSSQRSQTWTGKPIKPDYKITKKAAVNTSAGIGLKRITLKEGEDYIVRYKNNTNVGDAQIEITGTGKFSGTQSYSFKILPKGTSLGKLNGAKKAARITWKKQTTKMTKKHIDGYQIQLASDKGFKKNKRTVNVKGFKVSSKKVTKLKGDKKYYVRIRTYKTANGQKVYSKWSKVKTVKTH